MLQIKNMEDYIIKSNQEKYHQTEDSCPFLQEPLLSDFGYHGEGANFEAFCRGEYNIPNCVDSHTREFIQVCQQNNTVGTTNNKMLRSATEFQQSWGGWKKELRAGHYTLDILKHVAIMN